MKAKWKISGEKVEKYEAVEHWISKKGNIIFEMFCCRMSYLISSSKMFWCIFLFSFTVCRDNIKKHGIFWIFWNFFLTALSTVHHASANVQFCIKKMLQVRLTKLSWVILTTFRLKLYQKYWWITPRWWSSTEYVHQLQQSQFTKRLMQNSSNEWLYMGKTIQMRHFISPISQTVLVYPSCCKEDIYSTEMMTVHFEFTPYVVPTASADGLAEHVHFGTTSIQHTAVYCFRLSKAMLRRICEAALRWVLWRCASKWKCSRVCFQSRVWNHLGIS